jgi:putative hydrolase of the HAD superfamily
MPTRAPMQPPPSSGAVAAPGRVWLFDLDDTLHDATHAVFAAGSQAMTDYIVRHLGLDAEAAAALRRRYWQRYGATLLGLVRHHGVKAAHFLHETHLLPGLEERLRASAHDRAALARLRGRKLVLTNAPRAYALRVLGALGLKRQFEAVLTIEDMTMFGSHRPKPDARMLRHVAARLKVPPHRCTLVEDTLMHQKAACGIGMRTVWMRRYLRGRPAAARSALPPGAERGARRGRRPVYVGRMISSLQALRG